MRSKKTNIPSSSEPSWNSEVENNKSQLISMLNWYNYHKKSSDAKKYFIEFLKRSGESKDVLECVSKNANSLSTTIGWLCRIKIKNEKTFPKIYDEYITKEKNKIISDSTISCEIEKVVKDKKPSIQDNIENQLNEYLSEISIIMDNFLLSQFTKKVNFYDWLKDNDVKHQQAKNIRDYYKNNLLSELNDAKNEKCEQLKEAYSFLDKAQLNKYIKFVNEFVDSCEKWYDVNKQIALNNKAPRKRKPKSPLKQIEKLQFLKEHESLKSIPPTKIVGATQLWVYNVKYRTLGVYICNNPHGFSVKGCTILNFDVSESICKKLRQPDKILHKVLEGGKVSLKKILPSIRTKEKKLTGRINKDTILLKVL